MPLLNVTIKAKPKKPVVSDDVKKMFSTPETSGDISGDWLQLQESTFDDLKKRGKITKDIEFKAIHKDPKLYDTVARSYIDDLKTTFKIPTDKDAALWSFRPAYYKRYGGDISKIPDNKPGSFSKTARQVMEQRQKALKDAGYTRPQSTKGTNIERQLENDLKPFSIPLSTTKTAIDVATGGLSVPFTRIPGMGRAWELAHEPERKLAESGLSFQQQARQKIDQIVQYAPEPLKPILNQLLQPTFFPQVGPTKALSEKEKKFQDLAVSQIVSMPASPEAWAVVGANIAMRLPPALKAELGKEALNKLGQIAQRRGAKLPTIQRDVYDYLVQKTPYSKLKQLVKSLGQIGGLEPQLTTGQTRLPLPKSRGFAALPSLLDKGSLINQILKINPKLDRVSLTAMALPKLQGLAKTMGVTSIEAPVVAKTPISGVATLEAEPQTIEDVGASKPPAEPLKQIQWDFLKQTKPSPTIAQYFIPAEYEMEKLGFKEFIHKPVRNALQDFSVELQKKTDFINNVKKQFPKVNNDKVYEYMNKGIPDEQTPETRKATLYRSQTEEMLERLNDVRKIEGKPPIAGIKNYILHALHPDILTEIYEGGVIPLELAKAMEYIPPHTVFLRTAQQRKGVPEEWLIKDPDKLMRMMYAIDLRYIHLQKALKQIEPYLKAVKYYKGDETKGVKAWSNESYRYVKDWVEQAVKMRPSQWDKLVDNLMEQTLASILRNRGIRISHMPFRDLQMFLSSAAHTGALGMRIKPILRNLVQSTFDYVMYGAKPYLKANTKFGTKEGKSILNQSKVWKTRIPYEANEKATLNKVFKAGSIAYRFSDLHNVGKALLTRYYFATEKLKMKHSKAIDWMDNDLPSTQWSYRREDLPRAYWTTTGRAFWTLGSWWMNYYFRFLPEIMRKFFTGKDVTGRIVTSTERLAILRLLLLGGVLRGVKEATNDIVDYTGQITPTMLREGPTASLARALVDVYNGFAYKSDYQINKGIKELSRTAKIFIPFYLAGEDLVKFAKGEKDLKGVIFYGKNKKQKPYKRTLKVRVK